MATMTKSTLGAPFNGALDPFLMGSFGVEENGMALSVLSALARLGLDPWAEAGRLAALPKQAAADAIGRHLAPNGSPTIAAQLAALLPSNMTETATGDRPRRLIIPIHRNVWLWLALWLAGCVFYVTVIDTHGSQQRTEHGVSSDRGGQ